MRLKCGDCHYEADEPGFRDAEHILERHLIGDTFSDRECPVCGALAFPVPVPQSPFNIDLPHVIVVGDPARGFRIYGPFESHSDALHAATCEERLADDWWVMPIEPWG